VQPADSGLRELKKQPACHSVFELNFVLFVLLPVKTVFFCDDIKQRLIRGFGAIPEDNGG
jgi:hypothetical protein